jgi:hypothetical protein
MSTQANPQAQQIESQLTRGDEALAKKNFSDAYSIYSGAFTAAGKHFGFVAPELIAIIDKCVEAAYQHNAAGTESIRKNIGMWLKTALTIHQRQHGVRSIQLIPTLERLVEFYDFDGAHMLAIEVLQRIDDIKAANETV